MNRRPILLATGGTGGHVFPAEALAAELVSRGRSLVLVTDDRGSEFSGALANMPVHTVSAATITGRSLIGKAAALVEVARGTWQARKIIATLNPAAAIGFGGYPSLPAMLAASWVRVPTLIHEQNAVLGRVNRLLASRVSAIALSFAATRNLRSADQTKTQIIGNPVRPGFGAVPDYVAPAKDGPVRLLVTGGSQGAAVFSRIVPRAVAGLSESLRERLILTQQCRLEDMGAVGDAYRSQGVHADLSAFFTDLPERLAQSHLVLCRAGASTVAELGVAGRPALLVPYPFAVDDHQGDNAQAVAGAEAGWMMREDAMTPEALTETMERLLTSPKKLASAAAQARSQGRINAARELADMVDHLAVKNGGALPVPGRMVAGGEPAE